MVQISTEDVNSQQKDKDVKLNECSLSDRPKIEFTKHKLIRVSSQIGEFSIVHLIGWIDPISGFWIGFCFFLWHLVQALIEAGKNDKR